jgi:hypothetical protein
MTVDVTTRAPAEVVPVNRGIAEALRQIGDAAAGWRLAMQRGALVIAACIPPLALLLYVGDLPRLAVSAERVQIAAACSRIYDAAACSCAANAVAIPGPPEIGMPDDLLLVAAGRAPWAGRSEAARASATMTPDFVRQVQGCMAGGREAPAD